MYPHLFFQGWGGSRELGGREGNRSLKLLFVWRYFAMKMLNGVAQNCLGDWHPLGVQTTILSLVGWHFARKLHNGAAQNCPDNWHPLGNTDTNIQTCLLSQWNCDAYVLNQLNCEASVCNQLNCEASVCNQLNCEASAWYSITSWTVRLLLGTF